LTFLFDSRAHNDLQSVEFLRVFAGFGSGRHRGGILPTWRVLQLRRWSNAGPMPSFSLPISGRARKLRNSEAIEYFSLWVEDSETPGNCLQNGGGIFGNKSLD